MRWRFSAPAGDVEGSKLCLFSVIMPAKCVSSVSPRFHYRGVAFCFLPLAAILLFSLSNTLNKKPLHLPKLLLLTPFFLLTACKDSQVYFHFLFKDFLRKEIIKDLSKFFFISYKYFPRGLDMHTGCRT
jgi:hypothetical protein